MRLNSHESNHDIDDVAALSGLRPSRYRAILALILLASLALRLVLIFRGGQFFWPDEDRYLRSRWIVSALEAGRIPTLRRAEHFGFQLVGTIPAAIENVVGESPRIPATFFMLFSVANLGLVGLIARRAGAPPGEALWAVLLLASTNTFNYWSRHVVPYDAAMTFGLLGIFFGVSSSDRWWTSLVCGLFACAAFLTYSGYWALSLMCVLIHSLRRPFVSGKSIRRAMLAGVGFLGPLLILQLTSMWAGRNFLRSLATFSRTITPGDIHEAWSLPFEYLWHSEHLVLILWCAAFVFAAFQMIRRRADRVLPWLLASLGIYVTFVLLGNGLQMFVVYGRLVRQLVPFLCLLGAYAVHMLVSKHGCLRLALGGVAMLLIGQGVVNSLPAIEQTFPPEFRQLVKAQFPAREDVIFVNCCQIYGEPTAMDVASSRILLQALHPAQVKYYQYEGCSAQQRRKLRQTDVRMKAVLPDPNAPWAAVNQGGPPPQPTLVSRNH